MEDLIYAEDEVAKIISARYPSAVFEDASDMVHEERFGVKVSDVAEEEWFEFLVKAGIATVSLNVQLAMRIPGKSQDALKVVVEKLKEEKRLHG
jgi:hypothetical protein